MANQYEITIKSEVGDGDSQIAGTSGSSGNSKSKKKKNSAGKKFANAIAAAGIISTVASVENYLVGHVETWTGNKALQDQHNIGQILGMNAITFGVAAATGPLGIVAWGLGKATSFALHASDFYYAKQQETYARQLNYERQGEGRYFE